MSFEEALHDNFLQFRIGNEHDDVGHSDDTDECRNEVQDLGKRSLFVAAFQFFESFQT